MKTNISLPATGSNIEKRNGTFLRSLLGIIAVVCASMFTSCVAYVHEGHGEWHHHGHEHETASIKPARV